jgi:hypothetical protein
MCAEITFYSPMRHWGAAPETSRNHRIRRPRARLPATPSSSPTPHLSVLEGRHIQATPEDLVREFATPGGLTAAGDGGPLPAEADRTVVL